jgi:hypothetical protein
MTKNMGTVDRIVRAVLGVALLGWGYATGNWWGAIGIVPLLTAAVSFCPAYLPFGISTAKR